MALQFLLNIVPVDTIFFEVKKMKFFDFLNTNAAGIGALAPMLQLPLQAVQSYQNYGLQKENLAYQKAIQQKIFDREDTAIQRRVADLKAAGLNPLLAAGSGAGTGSYVPTVAPQIAPMDMMTPLATAQSMLESKSRIDTSSILTEKQVEQIDSVISKNRAEIQKTFQDIEESISRVNLNEIEAFNKRMQADLNRQQIFMMSEQINLIREQVLSSKQNREIDKEIYDVNKSLGFYTRDIPDAFLLPVMAGKSSFILVDKLIEINNKIGDSMSNGIVEFLKAFKKAAQSTGFWSK